MQGTGLKKNRRRGKEKKERQKTKKTLRKKSSSVGLWPLAPNFCSRAARKFHIFIQIIMVGTLEFTGSGH